VSDRAAIKQPDVVRIVKGAKQGGAHAIELRVRDVQIVIRLSQANPEAEAEKVSEIIL
jgi:hypothetical protein